MNKTTVIILIAILILLQLCQILLSSILTFTIFGEDMLIWIGNNENFYGIIIYGGGIISFPIATYLLFKTNHFQAKVSLKYLLVISTIIGLVLLIKHLFAFGVLLVSLFFLTVAFSISLEIFKDEE